MSFYIGYVYLHCLVQALGKKHRDTPYALYCVKNQEKKPRVKQKVSLFCIWSEISASRFLPTANINLSKSPESSFFMLSSTDSSAIFSYASKTVENRI